MEVYKNVTVQRIGMVYWDKKVKNYATGLTKNKIVWQSLVNFGHKDISETASRCCHCTLGAVCSSEYVKSL